MSISVYLTDHLLFVWVLYILVPLFPLLVWVGVVVGLAMGDSKSHSRHAALGCNSLPITYICFN